MELYYFAVVFIFFVVCCQTLQQKKRATEYFVCAAQHPTSFMQSCKDLGPVHRGMNINEREFVAVIDDTMKAMKQLKVGQREQEEMLYIMWMLKGSVVNL